MLKAGAVIAERYEIVGRIGSGGMADVYKARDTKLNRFVAVKVMKQEFKNDDSFIRKFRREAQAAAGLANPNIVNVFDVGEDNGLYYIVMELVEGITLKEYVAKKHKLSVREATSIAIQVCMGLSAAHAQGIVHRDIKPQNIIISTDGKVKVTDFGIARAASSNTISANAMGSVHYSSPEQVRGGYSDAKSDIYSLGITMYEMVTGRVPFDGETTVAIAIKHLQDELDPPSKYTPDLPYSLEQIIYKCTQKSPDRRYNSVNEVITDLKHSLTDPDGDFVTVTPLADHATVSITPEEAEKIRRANTIRRVEADSEGEKKVTYVEPEPYDDDDDEGISTALEKAMTIGGFIIGAIIIGILIFFIGRAAGLFKTRSAAENSSSTPAASTASAAESSGTSSTTGSIETPRLLGLTRSQAQTTVSGLSIGIKYAGEETNDEYPEGQICRQDPEPGAPIARNSTVVFYVSAGKAKIQIPRVVGISADEAKRNLTEAGFTNVVTEETPSDSVVYGNVISVSPNEGASVDPATKIVLTVSTGTEEIQSDALVRVTEVRGLNIDLARQILENSGLRVTTTVGHTDTLAEDDVMAMSIAGDTEVAKGTEIVLTVNRPESEVPNASYEESNTAESEEASYTGDNNTEVEHNWVTVVRLDATTEYSGGAYRLTLVQNVNGTNEEITIEEGESLSFPYDFSYSQGAAGVSTGDVYLYELTDGSYIRKAKWTVPFKAAG